MASRKNQRAPLAPVEDRTSERAALFLRITPSMKKALEKRQDKILEEDGLYVGLAAVAVSVLRKALKDE
jgi:hypothetical protein